MTKSTDPKESVQKAAAEVPESSKPTQAACRANATSHPSSSRTEPPWWVRDGALALAVGLVLLLVQLTLDDRRSDRELTRATELNRQAEQLENLRFVRDRSTGGRDLRLETYGLGEPCEERVVDRPFSRLDLSGLDLSGLNLSNADLRGANLSGARLDGTDFCGADLSEANFARASLVDAGLREVTADCLGTKNFDCVDFSEAILIGADLSEGHFGGAQFDRAVLGGKASAGYTEVYGASFVQADFDGAWLVGLKLANAEVPDLRDACFDATTSFPSDYAFELPPDGVTDNAECDSDLLSSSSDVLLVTPATEGG